MAEQTILGVCCGSRMFWFNKQDTRTVFADIRAEEHELCDGHRLVISPDLIADFRALPFADATFPVVVFARCGNAFPPPFAEALVRANLPELCHSKQIAA